MEKEIIKITKDVEHVKETTDKIETTVSALLEKFADQSGEIVEIRGRVRELEHEHIESKQNIAELRSLIWKIAAFLATSGGSAVAALEIFSK